MGILQSMVFGYDAFTVTRACVYACLYALYVYIYIYSFAKLSPCHANPIQFKLRCSRGWWLAGGSGDSQCARAPATKSPEINASY